MLVIDGVTLQHILSDFNFNKKILVYCPIRFTPRGDPVLVNGRLIESSRREVRPFQYGVALYRPDASVDGKMNLFIAIVINPLKPEDPLIVHRTPARLEDYRDAVKYADEHLHPKIHITHHMRLHRASLKRRKLMMSATAGD